MLCRLKVVSKEAEVTGGSVSIVHVISGLVEEKVSVCMRRILVNVTLESLCFVSLLMPTGSQLKSNLQGPEHKHTQNRDLLANWEL